MARKNTTNELQKYVEEENRIRSEASLYGIDSYEDYKKKNRFGLKGASKGATTGAMIGTKIMPGVGTAIGAVMGGAAGLAQGMGEATTQYRSYAKDMIEQAKQKKAAETAQEELYRKAMAEQRAAELERQKALYAISSTQPMVAGEMPMYKKGGVAKMVMINVEKGELAVDPRTMKVIMDFNDVPKHPKGKDVINQKGNVKVPVGTIIIPADMRKDFLKAEPGQRIEMAAELIERQREGEEKEMEENEGMEEQAMPQGIGMAQEQMPQGQGMMAMMDEEGGEEMERMQEGGLASAVPFRTNFEKRIMNPFLYIQNPDKTRSTHEMMSFEVGGKYYAAPTIVEKKNKLVRLSPDEAIDYALKNKEYKQFKTEKEAQQYAEGGYKKGTPLEKYGNGGYIKKYQGGTPGVITYDKPINVPTESEYMQIPGGIVDYGMLTSYYSDKEKDNQQKEALSDILEYRQRNKEKGDATGTEKNKVAGSGAGLSGYAFSQGLGMLGAAIPQYFAGREQEKEAKKALEALQGQPMARYTPTAELQRSKQDVEAARERARYGFSAAERAAREQQISQMQRQAYQRARETGLSGTGQAMLAALGSQRIQAANEMAIQDQRLQLEKQKYAEMGARSIADAYQRLQDAQTSQDIRYRTMQEQAYGGALRAGLENQYGAFSTAGAGLGYAAGSGLSSLLGLL